MSLHKYKIKVMISNNKTALSAQIILNLIRHFSAETFDLARRHLRFTINIHKYLLHIYLYVPIIKTTNIYSSITGSHLMLFYYC